MEDLLKKMFMFVMSAKEDDVLCIHIEETGETSPLFLLFSEKWYHPFPLEKASSIFLCLHPPLPLRLQAHARQLKLPRQIIFIIDGLENKNSNDQMQMPSSPLGPSAQRMLHLPMLDRLRILFHCHCF